MSKDKSPEVINSEEEENNEAAGKKTSKTNSKKTKKNKKEDALSQQIEELTEERDELKNKFLRKVAEFDNFKKRTSRERLDLLGSAAKETIISMLPVLDDFQRAIKAANDDTSTEPVSEGVMLVYEKLNSTLLQKGLKPMETNGEVFDADLHEAITEIPAPTEDLKGKIVDTVETGYYLNDKIIRFPKVVIGK